MSGRKQHFIPQSLLRGFGRVGKGSKIQVVAYTRDYGTFVAATDGVGAERAFYSELSVGGEDETLDDKITAYETTLASALATLRGLSDGEAADRELAAAFLTHLIVRNDHFRKAVSSAGSAVIGGITELISTDLGAKELVGLTQDTPNALVQAEMTKAWQQFGSLIQTAGMSQTDFEAAMFGELKNNFSSMFAEIRLPLMAAISEMLEKVPDVSADAQRRSFANELSPPIRVEKLAAFHWRVIHVESKLVLPDCIAVAFDRDWNAFPLMFAEMETVETIFAPLSSNRLLIGSHTAAAMPPDNLNEAFATCSWDFFVADDSNETLEKLRAKLRNRVSQFLDETVETAIEEAVIDHKSGD